MSFDVSFFDGQVFGLMEGESCLFDPVIFDSELFDVCEDAVEVEIPSEQPRRRRIFTLLQSTSAAEQRLKHMQRRAEREEEEIREVLAVVVPMLRAA